MECKDRFDKQEKRITEKIKRTIAKRNAGTDFTQESVSGNPIHRTSCPLDATETPTLTEMDEKQVLDQIKGNVPEILGTYERNKHALLLSFTTPFLTLARIENDLVLFEALKEAGVDALDDRIQLLQVS